MCWFVRTFPEGNEKSQKIFPKNAIYTPQFGKHSNHRGQTLDNENPQLYN